MNEHKKHMDNYEDIIHLPHPISKKHPLMSRANRAAQFAPFAALTGHKEAVMETGRLTQMKKELDEHQKAILDEKLRQILLNIKEQPLVKVVYFQQDAHKEGGAYFTVIKRVRNVDEVYHQLMFVDRSMLSLEDIMDVELLDLEHTSL